jgi:superfamily I DNA/RNA helicase
MLDSSLKIQILKLINIHSLIKARRLAQILGIEFGKHVDTSDVNKTLYKLKSEGIVSQNKSYEWGLENSKVASDVGLHPLRKIPTIEFTEEQQSIINLDPSNHLLIRGQAGSGKTTVLAARAGQIISATNKGSLLFLTYNAALTNYVKSAFTKSGIRCDIDVKTFHNWANSTSKDLGFSFSGWVNSKSRADQLKVIFVQAIKEVGKHRLFDLTDSPKLLNWWGDEISWIFGQHIVRLDEYLITERIGRGTSIRVSKEDRHFIWAVYEIYTEWLEENKKEDYDNPSGIVLRVLMEQDRELPDDLRYDHVMIDEVQDFDKSWLLAVMKIPRVSLSLAGDLAQKIYRRNFSWSSVGIQVQGGRSRRLSKTHRSTKQIMDVAELLLKNNDVALDPDFSPPAPSNKNGDKVLLLKAEDAKAAYSAGYDWIAKRFKKTKTATIAILFPFSNQLYPAQKELEKRGLSVIAAKGAKLGGLEKGIVVTTYHQVKGLEFDDVVIMGLHDNQFPGRSLERLPNQDEAEMSQVLDLSRRLLYVAMTRAKKSVTLVGSDPFCRFFSEVPDEYFEIIQDAEDLA